HDPVHDVVVGGRERLGDLGEILSEFGHPSAHARGVDPRAQLCDEFVGEFLAPLNAALFHPSTVGNDDEEHRVVDAATSSTCRSEDRRRVGYFTTATWWVSWARRRTVRSRVSSRSMPPPTNCAIAFRSAADSGLRSTSSWSTKSRYPASVGILPAEVWGWAMRPAS